MSVIIETTIGDITVDLFLDERPIACLNFLKLCRLKYYNFNLFHTVEQGFIAQTGDPTGAGDQGCSIWGLIEGQNKRFFEGENIPKIFHTSAGLLSMVGAGKQMLGSQFFFTLADNLTSLDGNHCVIGEVVEGHEVLRKLNESIVDENFRPFQDIRITHTVILEDPYPDPRGFRVPSRSPSPTAERLKNGRIAADEDIDDTDGKSMAEIQEMLAEREAKARATILEIVGDLPDADMAPPENVLFVCKLNPVTSDDDLEIIFSRFGKVKSCEVIRDKKTGDSLQYAFVEFEEQKSCEAAYFKMDNVLIDDRRIHVDFSQSIAKVKWRGKGRGIEGVEGRLNFNNLKESGVNRAKKHDQQTQRQQQQQQQHQQERNGHRYERQDRMTSEERRCAREARHKQQEQQEIERQNDKQRQRSRERTPTRDRNREVRRSRERIEKQRNNISRERNERRVKDERERECNRERERERFDRDRERERERERERFDRERERFDRERDHRVERSKRRHGTRSRSNERGNRRDYQQNRNDERTSRRYSKERRYSPNRQHQSRTSPIAKKQHTPSSTLKKNYGNKDYDEKISKKSQKKLKEKSSKITKEKKQKKKRQSTSEESSSSSSSSSGSSSSSSDSS